jgi:hypothetical protein
MTKEYEFSGSFEIGVSGECMGKLKVAELKKKLKKEIENFFENNDCVAEYDIYQNEHDFDYDEIDL